MGTELSFQRKLFRMLVAAAIIGNVALAPEMSSAEGLLDFFFGGQKQQHQTSFFANVFNNNQQPPPSPAVVASSGPAFCVRSCDGKYFPLRGSTARGGDGGATSRRRWLLRSRFDAIPQSPAQLHFTKPLAVSDEESFQGVFDNQSK